MSREEILSEFQEAIKGPNNRYIGEWKNKGGKVMGYFCTFVPVELFTAAGILPVRIRGAGSTDSSEADAYLSHRLCTFIRHATALALNEQYDFLDGEISLNTCDHVRRASDVWRQKTNIGFHGFLSVPRNARESLAPWFVEEVSILKEQIEKHFNVKITDGDLRKAIGTHNRIRERLIRMNDMRRRNPSPISGADSLTMSIASQLMPPEKFIEMADEFLDESENYEPPDKPRARLIVIGGELDEPAFLRVIESQNAQIVGDNVCYGVRYAHQLVPESGAPLERICRNYFFNVECARMVGGFPARFDNVQRLIRECSADGVIFQKMKFCDVWGSDQHKTINRFKMHGRQLLVLDREYGVSGIGQIKTRVQAFLEALGK